MNHLTRNDYAGALRLLAGLEPAAGDTAQFARAAVGALNDFVASELTTLSVCDLVTARPHAARARRLHCLAHGKTDAEIGVLLSIRPAHRAQTPRAHLHQARRRNAHGRRDACARMRPPDGQPLAALIEDRERRTA